MGDSELCPLNEDSFSIEVQKVDVINFQEKEDRCWEKERYDEEGFEADGKIWHVT